jgi:PAS domain S-box-containing protein
MKDFISKNAITVIVLLVIALLILNTALSVYNKNEMERNAAIKIQTDTTSSNVRNLLNDIIHNIDLGVRGYGITQKEGLLDPAQQAFKKIDNYFKNIETVLNWQSYDKNEIIRIQNLHTAFNNYASFSKSMIAEVQRDSLATFKKMMEEDRGLALYLNYRDVAQKIFQFETALNAKATIEYENAQQRSMYLQIILLLVGLPILGFILFRIREDENNRLKLLNDLEENNRKYIFNPGTEITSQNPKEVIENSIENFKDAASFVKKIAEGDYDATWEKLNDSNASLNQENLAGELIRMKENMKTLKAEDERRLWANEGLSKFSEIVRNNQHDLASLSDEAIRFLVHYLKAQQGGLFVLQNDGNSPYLELTACYAFNRKKYMQKRIEPGEGLVGQAFMEKEYILLTDIPEGYTFITSGLGDSTPSCLLLIPLKYNEVIEGVLEIASFNIFTRHQINFLEKAGEFIASSMLNVKTTAKMRHLLEESQQQSEEMRAAEEEMRQNMEEMEATQEEMQRQAIELKKVQASMELEKNMFLVMMENTKDRITYKDTESRILRVNKAKSLRFNTSPENMIGKTDYDYFPAEHAEKAMREEKRLMNSGEAVHADEKIVFENGDVMFLHTSRIPFKDSDNQTIGIFIDTKDITEEKFKEALIEDQLKLIRGIETSFPVFSYKVEKSGVITNIFKGKLSDSSPDVLLLANKNTTDFIPEFNSLLEYPKEKEYFIFKSTLTIASKKATFQHYVFEDTILKNVYWGFALEL